MKPPLATSNVGEKIVISTTWDPIHTVIGAHDSAGSSFLYALLKWWLEFLQIIGSEVFAASGSLKMIPYPTTLEAVTLYSSHERHRVFPCRCRVFARRFLASPPSRVSEYVYVWCPEQVLVERRGGEDDLREAGGAADRTTQRNALSDVGDSVQSLRPPVVGGNAEAGNGGGGVHELGDLLVQREARDQIPDSEADGEIRLAEVEGFVLWVGGIAGERRWSRLGGGANKEQCHPKHGGEAMEFHG
nr:hypothetical protein CRG98_031993 [Ipomoea trifida]